MLFLINPTINSKIIAPTKAVTPEQVREHVLQNLEIFTHGGGFVFSTVRNILSEVRPENILAAFDAVRQFNGEQSVTQNGRFKIITNLNPKSRGLQNKGMFSNEEKSKNSSV